MPVIHFLCPHCSAALRVRDRSFLGQQVACPDCQAPLLIVEDPSGQVIGQPVVTSPAPNAPEPREAPVPAAEWPKFNWESLRQVPPAISWGLAAASIIAAVCLLWFSLRTPDSTPSTTSSPPAATSPEDGDDAAAPVAPPGDVPPDEAPGETATARLTFLGEWLLGQVEENDAFPTGTITAGDRPVDDRLSWLSELSVELAGGVAAAPLWDQGWRDPLNEPFVRRGVVEFRNPAVADLVGADGYPATHFVGVAGLGADGPRLPAEDPRAGIFAENRQTTLADIKDGAANTMLVAGVQSRLGSWAAGGAATIRPFVKQPYVNGPDGFGTGQPDSMLVLMADGSVRTIAKNTAPEIIEDLATIASHPAPTLPAPSPPAVAETAPPVPMPMPATPTPPADPTAAVAAIVEDSAATGETPIDIEARLGQSIDGYRERTELGLQLYQIEELLGVKIAYVESDLQAAGLKLDQRISLQLKDVTVAEILQALLGKSGLTYRVEEQQIRIIPAPPAPQP